MGKRVAIVICNWNKQEHVLQCIASVLNSRYDNFDLYIVDNASTDDSVIAIESTFGEKAMLIRNRENLGGSGGFNAGMRRALQGQYDYVHLLDNDVIVDRDWLLALVNFMDEHPETGAVGSKIYVRGQDNRLQEMGAEIDWARFTIRPHYKGVEDYNGIPEIVDCDYVPACSVLLRTSVLRKVGLMDESYFIYWDDIEWFHRMKQGGSRIVAYGRSRVWHQMGASGSTTTFPTYYFWRNRLHFFTQYTHSGSRESLASIFFADLFQAIYFSLYKNQQATVDTLLLAVSDAIQAIRGKAESGRIKDKEPNVDRIEQILKGITTDILIMDTADIKLLKDLVNKIGAANPEVRIRIEPMQHLQRELSEQLPTVEFTEAAKLQDKVYVIQPCNHILDERHRVKHEIDLYVDGYFNVISTAQDKAYIESFDEKYEQARRIYLPLLRTKLEELYDQLSESR